MGSPYLPWAARTVANHQIMIHMTDEFIGKKKATRSQKINVMEREGACTVFLLPGGVGHVVPQASFPHHGFCKTPV